MDAVFFHILKDAACAIIAVVCFLRATKLDQRARPAVKLVLVLLSMTSVGLLLAKYMPDWMADACYVGVLWAFCLMLIEGEKRWRNGPPDELLREEELYPRKNRRSGNERRKDWLGRNVIAP